MKDKIWGYAVTTIDAEEEMSSGAGGAFGNLTTDHTVVLAGASLFFSSQISTPFLVQAAWRVPEKQPPLSLAHVVVHNIRMTHIPHIFLSGQGVGLPVARTYAEYFGGSLERKSAGPIDL
jgi:hypothetical protein